MPPRLDYRAKSLCPLYRNRAPAFSTLYGGASYICGRNGRTTMYDALLVIMGLAMFAAFLAYAATCEKM